MKAWFKSIENLPEGTTFPVEKVLEELNFDDKDLIPVIAQDHESLEVLMFAWMNRDALAETIATQCMCYWSRSRQSLWRKGESSGHWQRLKSLSIDCDGDVLLAKIEQQDAACHTNRRSCFYLQLEGDKVVLASS